jgi:chromosomal replication initiation ATPase DnaA
MVMQADNSAEFTRFLKEVYRVVKKYGIDRVSKQLRRIENYSSERFNSEICTYIVDITSKHYNISREDIMVSNKRGDVTEARRMCFALVKEHLGYTYEKIGEFFGGKTKQFVFQEVNMLPINDDHLVTKHEKQFVNDFMELTKKVYEHKNRLYSQGFDKE